MSPSPVDLQTMVLVASPDTVDLVAVARAARDARRRRATIMALPIALFHEPAWDILLDLFIADADGTAPDFTAICANAAIQGPTALRWITTLEQLGFVRAVADPAFGMPTLHITDRARHAMRDYLSTV